MESSFFLSFTLGYFKIFQKTLRALRVDLFHTLSTYTCVLALYFFYCLFEIIYSAVNVFLGCFPSYRESDCPPRHIFLYVQRQQYRRGPKNTNSPLILVLLPLHKIVFIYKTSHKCCGIFKKTYIIVTYFEHDKLLPHWLVHVYNVIGPQILQHMW